MRKDTHDPRDEEESIRPKHKKRRLETAVEDTQSTFNKGFERRRKMLVVDAISSGAEIARLLKPTHEVHHLASLELKRLHEETGIKHSRECIEKEFTESGNLRTLLQQIAPHNYSAIIPVSEPGVPLANKLNKEYKMKNASDPKYAEARVDKYFMHKRMQEAKLSYCGQIKTKKLQSLLTWYRKLKRKQIVIKPARSADTIGVHFCNNEAEVHAAFEELIKSKTIFGEKITSVVAQERLLGQEYMVNVVIDPNKEDGETYFTSILPVIKKTVDGKPVYNYTYTLPQSDPAYQRIVQYVTAAAKAFGLKGAGHFEVIDDGEKGITLVEINARPMGSIDMSFMAQSRIPHGSHVQVTAEAYTDPAAFQARCKNAKKEQEKCAVIIFFIAPNDVELRNTPMLDAIKKMPGFESIKFVPTTTKSIEKTTGPLNMPGMANFLVERPEQVSALVKAFRKQEALLYEQISADKNEPASISQHSLPQPRQKQSTASSSSNASSHRSPYNPKTQSHTSALLRMSTFREAPRKSALCPSFKSAPCGDAEAPGRRR